MYHIVVMHSQCILACPTLSVWSCIQVHGLGLIEHRLEASKRRPEKQNLGENLLVSAGFLFFWFYTVFLVFGSENQKTPVILISLFPDL